VSDRVLGPRATRLAGGPRRRACIHRVLRFACSTHLTPHCCSGMLWRARKRGQPPTHDSCRPHMHRVPLLMLTRQQATRTPEQTAPCWAPRWRRTRCELHFGPGRPPPKQEGRCSLGPLLTLARLTEPDAFGHATCRLSPVTRIPSLPRRPTHVSPGGERARGDMMHRPRRGGAGAVMAARSACEKCGSCIAAWPGGCRALRWLKRAAAAAAATATNIEPCVGRRRRGRAPAAAKKLAEAERLAHEERA